MEHEVGLKNTVECTEPVELEIKGIIPKWIRGNLYRAGPGKFDIETDNGNTFHFQHWFDGLSQLHKFELGDGKVKYRNRFVATGMEEAIKKGEFDGVTFGQDPCTTFFSKLFSLFSKPKSENISNVSVVVDTNFNKEGRVIVQTDANLLLEVEEESLKPKALFTYSNISPKISGMLSAAHTCIDPKTGEIFNFALDFGPSMRYQIFGIKGEEVNIYGTIKAPGSYIHSFGLTENYIIFLIYPYYFGMMGLEIPWKRNILQSLHWHEDQPTLIYVIDRNTKEMKKYETDPFFCYHHFNAFEDGKKIVFDLCGYKDSKAVELLNLDNLRNGKIDLPQGHALRFVIDENGSITRKVLYDQGAVELPRINPKFYAKSHEYAYFIHAHPNCKFIADSLLKLNVKTGEYLVWKEEGQYPGEPMFLPKEGNQVEDEDEGVILSVILNSKAAASYLLVLDAKTFKEIGRALVPQVICFGFHGDFQTK